MHSEPLLVIGVVKDFLFQNAAREVDPMAITAYSERIRTLCVRIRPGTDPEAILERIYEPIRSFDPDYVMVNRYASDIYLNYYKGDGRDHHTYDDIDLCFHTEMDAPCPCKRRSPQLAIPERLAEGLSPADPAPLVDLCHQHSGGGGRPDADHPGPDLENSKEKSRGVFKV
jgi:hypothetical protein